MRKLKHSKLRNSGFLFELLVRQVAADILNGTNAIIAENILRKYFGPKTELSKELKLYQILMKQKYTNESKAENFVSLVIKTRRSLNNIVLKKDKYNLIKEIRDSFDLNEFMRAPLGNYKVLASIYKVFENETSSETFYPNDVISAKYTLIEHIIDEQNIAEKSTSLIETYKKQGKDLRILTYRILLEKFNDKYTDLSDDQKNLLREYINSISNTTSLRDYISKQVPLLKKRLIELHNKVDDKVTSIKLQEIIKQLDSIRRAKKVCDNHVSAMMVSYELIKELSNVT